MAFVLDCSVTMAWVFPDEASASTDALQESLVEDSAFVPALWPGETGNVLLTATRRGRIAKDDWRQIRESLQALPINIDPVSTDRVLGGGSRPRRRESDLGGRHDVSRTRASSAAAARNAGPRTGSRSAGFRCRSALERMV